MILRLLLGSILTSVSSPTQDSHPQTLSGKVIGVTGSDTLKILVDRKPVTIRFEDIDTPEKRMSQVPSN
jgi:endonuclease YncB( thermonuclease family)